MKKASSEQLTRWRRYKKLQLARGCSLDEVVISWSEMRAEEIAGNSYSLMEQEEDYFRVIKIRDGIANSPRGERKEKAHNVIRECLAKDPRTPSRKLHFSLIARGIRLSPRTIRERRREVEHQATPSDS